MTKSFLRPALLASVLLISGTTLAAAADAGQWQASQGFPGSMRAGSREMPVKPGDKTTIQIHHLKPGTQITVMRGTEVLTATPVTADAKGNAIVPITVPADAQYGMQPLTVISSDPSFTAVVDLKLSKVLAPSNEEGFDVTSAKTGERSYQAALSDDGKLYVVSAFGKDEPSEIVRIDAATMKFEASAPAAKDADGNVINAFAVGYDDAHDQIWTSDTKDNTVTVYDGKTMQPVKTFPAGTVAHPRDVVIDSVNHRAYSNDALSDRIEVFDTNTLKHIDTLRFEPPAGKGSFGTMTLDLDAQQGRIYSVSKDSNVAGWIDLKTGESHSFTVPGLNSGSGIAHDPKTGRMFVAGQDSNDVIILDKDGKKLSDTYIGAGALSVAFDPKTSHIYAATRAAGTVSVLDEDGKLLANLPAGELPNQVIAAGDGTVYAVTMNGATGDNDSHGSVLKITPAQ